MPRTRWTLWLVGLVALAALSPAVRAAAPAVIWHDVATLPVEGRAWNDTQSFYDRLPARAKGVVRDVVWTLSLDSAGMAVRFVTDSPTVAVRWKLRKERLAMTHMPATGVSGVDLYARNPEGKWRWVGCGRPEKFPENEQVLYAGEAVRREYLLYLPLYNGVEAVHIGLADGRQPEAAPAWPGGSKPIVFYGTSITHGASASRPGMCHPAILGRRLDRPVVNLGFSGNGRMDPEVGDLLAELDVAAYVIDCLPNLQAAEVRERTEPLVRKLRAARPTTPIVLVEDRNYSDSWWSASRRQRNETNQAALREAYGKLTSDGVTGLFYVEGRNLLGEDTDDTVDGSHPTDLGFFRQADALEPVLRQALAR